MTIRSTRVESRRFDIIYNPPSQILAEYFSCKSTPESFDSCRIVSIRQHFQSPFTDTCGIFSNCLENRHPVWRVVICCDDSFDSTASSAPFHRNTRNVFQVSSKSTSGMTGRHLLWRFLRFDCVFDLPSQLLAEYFLSVLQIDIRHDGSSFVVTSRSIRVDSCRFDNVFNPLSQILANWLSVCVSMS